MGYIMVFFIGTFYVIIQNFELEHVAWAMKIHKYAD